MIDAARMSRGRARARTRDGLDSEPPPFINHTRPTKPLAVVLCRVVLFDLVHGRGLRVCQCMWLCVLCLDCVGEVRMVRSHNPQQHPLTIAPTLTCTNAPRTFLTAASIIAPPSPPRPHASHLSHVHHHPQPHHHHLPHPTSDHRCCACDPCLTRQPPTPQRRLLQSADEPALGPLHRPHLPPDPVHPS